VYICDETTVSVEQHKNVYVIAMKGKRAVTSLVTAERGCLVTVVISMNVAGQFVPLLVVFPQKKMQVEFMDWRPQGSTYACHIGMVQTEIFKQWFRHFNSVAKPTTEDQVLLILDGECSHMRTTEVIKLGRENNVSVLCMPP
jgi:hypothetical protein